MRSRLLTRLSLAAAAALLTAAAPDATALAQTQKVQIGNSGSSMLWGVPYVAQRRGHFAAEGVEFEEVPQSGSNNTINAVIAGDLPFGTGGLNDLIIANSRGQPLRAIALLIKGYPNFLAVQKAVAAKTDVTPASPLEARMAFLKGRSIVVTVAGSSTDIFLRGILGLAKLDPERDVTIVYGGNGANTVAAAVSNRVDAGVFAPPDIDQLILSGQVIKWIDPLVGEYPPVDGMEFSVLYARAATLAAQPKIAQALVNAIAKAQQDMRANKIAARDAIRPNFGRLPVDVFNSAFETMYPAFPDNPVMSQEGYAATLRFVNSRTGQPAVTVPFEQVVDQTYVKALPAK